MISSWYQVDINLLFFWKGESILYLKPCVLLNCCGIIHADDSESTYPYGAISVDTTNWCNKEGVKPNQFGKHLVTAHGEFGRIVAYVIFVLIIY